MLNHNDNEVATVEAVVELIDTTHATTVVLHGDYSNSSVDDGNNDHSTGGGFEALVVLHATRWLPSLLDSLLRGAGQVMFLNSIFSGLLVAVALVAGKTWVGLLGLLGGFVATVTATVAGVQLEGAAMLHEGLLSYNGVLVGCAFAVFLNDGRPWEGGSVVATVVGASFSSMVSLALKAMHPKTPSWTWGFNIVAIPVLLFVRPFDVTNTATAVGQQVNTNTTLLNATAVPTTSTPPMEAVHFLHAIVSGMSQIFVLDSVVAGGLLIAACFVFSPCLAATGVLGSAIGTLTALIACNVDQVGLVAGLHGYNPALTALAVAVFFVPTGQALVLGLGGAIATSVLSAGASAAFGGAFSSPVLTMPFCVVASFCFYLGSIDVIPGLRIAPTPHSPEGNFKFRRAG